MEMLSVIFWKLFSIPIKSSGAKSEAFQLWSCCSICSSHLSHTSGTSQPPVAASSSPCLSTLLLLELRHNEPTFNARKASLWGPFLSGIKESHPSGQQGSKGARAPCPAHSSCWQSPAGAHKPLKWSLRVQGATETYTGALSPLASGIYPAADEQVGIKAGKHKHH